MNYGSLPSESLFRSLTRQKIRTIPSCWSSDYSGPKTEMSFNEVARLSSKIIIVILDDNFPISILIELVSITTLFKATHPRLALYLATFQLSLLVINYNLLIIRFCYQLYMIMFRGSKSDSKEAKEDPPKIHCLTLR
jgi:hypothetical protein